MTYSWKQCLGCKNKTLLLKLQTVETVLLGTILPNEGICVEALKAHRILPASWDTSSTGLCLSLTTNDFEHECLTSENKLHKFRILNKNKFCILFVLKFMNIVLIDECYLIVWKLQHLWFLLLEDIWDIGC